MTNEIFGKVRLRPPVSPWFQSKAVMFQTLMNRPYVAFDLDLPQLDGLA